jgi:adenylylsulfate kinase
VDDQVPGGVVWLTGLPSAGKTTVAQALAGRLRDEGVRSYVLDGDVVRKGLNADLGFTAEARCENVRRVGEVAALFADAGLTAIVALISPYVADRDRARQRAGERFVEVYVDCPLDVCKSRDPKGLYARAAAGKMKGLTGVDDPYEPPIRPEAVLYTDREDVAACVEKVLAAMRACGMAPSLARSRREA